MFSNRFPVFAPETGGMGGPSGEAPPDSSRSDMDILDDIEIPEDEPKPEEEPEEEPEPETTEDETETPEDENTEEEPEETTEENTDDLEETDRVTVKAVNKKYPKFFKEFPELRQSLFLSRQYQEVFATPDEAKEAQEAATTYGYFQEKFIGGSSKELLQSLRESGDADAYKNFVENFLPTLHATDDKQYYAAVKPVLQTALFAAFREAQESENKNLALAARWINKWLFGTDEVKAPTARPENKIDPERQKFLEDKARWETERFMTQYSEIANDIHGQLMKHVMKDLDPQNKRSEYTRKKLADDVVRGVGSILESDKGHIRTMDSIWDGFRKSGMPRNGKSRIIDTYLARALRVLPGVKSRLRAEALGRRAQAPNSRVPAKSGQKETRNSPPNRGASSGAGKKNEFAGMTDREILDRVIK